MYFRFFIYLCRVQPIKQFIKMTVRTKELLIEALFIYDNAPDSERLNLIAEVRDQLAKHKNAYNLIGFGLSDNYVTAGRLFLRIVTKH